MTVYATPEHIWIDHLEDDLCRAHELIGELTVALEIAIRERDTLRNELSRNTGVLADVSEQPGEMLRKAQERAK